MAAAAETILQELDVRAVHRLRSFEEIQHFLANLRRCRISAERADCQRCRFKRRGERRFRQCFHLRRAFGQRLEMKGSAFACSQRLGRHALRGFFQMIKNTHVYSPLISFGYPFGPFRTSSLPSTRLIK